MKSSTQSTQLAPLRWHQCVQATGALNDNLFKLIALFALISWHPAEVRAQMLAWVGVVFALPFIGFTNLGGYLADRCDKTRIVLRLKQAELAIMCLGVVALSLQSVPLLFATLFLMSAQSALYGPSKLALMPELVDGERLVKANSLLQAFTYLAIIAGTALAPALAYAASSHYHVAAVGCIGISLLGVFAAVKLAEGRARGDTLPAPQGAGAGSLRRGIAVILADRWMRLALVGLSGFSFIAAFTQLNVIDFGVTYLGMRGESSGAILLIAGLGMGLGALLAGRMSQHSVEYGVIPLGAMGVALSLFLTGTVGTQSVAATFGSILLLGMSGGLMTVPLQTFLQQRSPEGTLGAVVGISGLLNWVAILGASGVLYFTDVALGWEAGERFLALAGGGVGLAVFAMVAIPDFFGRLILSFAARLFYRVDYRAVQQLPRAGGALLVSNHLSLLDAVLVSGATPRRIRWLMSRDAFSDVSAWERWLCRLARVILIHEGDNPKRVLQSLQTAREALAGGELVGIFAEGHLSRRNMLLPFKGGFTRILKGTVAPVIPVAIGGMWGSWTTYAGGRPSMKPWRDGRRRVVVRFGAAVSGTVSPFAVRQAVSELSAELATLPEQGDNLARAWVGAARQHFSDRCLSDSNGLRLNYGEALCGSLLIQSALKHRMEMGKSIGILLPASGGGALANLAVTLAGSVPVNLNFKAGSAAIHGAIQQAEVRVIITATSMPVEPGLIPPGVEMVYLDTLMQGFSKGQKAWAFFKARYFPTVLLGTGLTRSSDATAVILFTSGSTRMPKGVCLSHRNILSNARSFGTVLRLQETDKVLGCLPFFHSFGLTATLWCPLLNGVSVAYHANPLDSRRIGECAEREAATILLSTPTFLRAYERVIPARQLRSLRYVFCAAERMPESLADSFEQTFGVRPLQGYGATELAPITTINLPDEAVDGFFEVGTRAESVGRPLPGVAIQIVDPETLSPREAGKAGLIRVKGPNVMLGYLGLQDETAAVLRDGWYSTGDIGVLDEDGFLRITDRLARFAKIGGEMVSLSAVEQLLGQALGVDLGCIACVTIPDSKKGEQLVGFVGGIDLTGDVVHAALRHMNCPNLWKPGADGVWSIPALPLLPTGKRDYGHLKHLALEKLNPQRAEVA